MTQSTTPDQTFETRLTRLQEVMDKLNSDELTLDESVALYREGQTLAKACGELLDKAKTEVKVLSETGETLTFKEQSPEVR